MASWPTAPDVQGNGATENDLRRIVGAQYMNQGILPNGGLAVSGRSDMSYLVESGAAFMWTSQSERLGVLVPVETVTIPTEAAPASGSRTDSIYMLRDGIPRVTSGAPPSTGVLLGKFIIGAGVTSTRAGQKTIDREYAIATGASLGRLAHWDIPGGNWTGEEGVDVLRYSEQFQVPSDRLVRVDVSASARSSATGDGWTALGIEIDGDYRRALHMVHTSDAERTYSATWTADLSEGTHTLTVFTRQFKGAALKTAPNASASEVNLWDAGVSQ